MPGQSKLQTGRGGVPDPGPCHSGGGGFGREKPPGMRYLRPGTPSREGAP